MKTRAALFLALAASAAAQTGSAPTLAVTFDHQPYAVLKAAYLTSIRTVGVYSADVCNDSAEELKTDGGFVLAQFKAGTTNKFFVVSAALNGVTIKAMREQSRTYRYLRALQWAGMLAGLYTGTGALAAGTAGAGAIAGITITADRLSTQYNTAGLQQTDQAPMLITGQAITLQPAACAGFIYLAEWKAKQGFQTFSARVFARQVPQGAPVERK